MVHLQMLLDNIELSDLGVYPDVSNYLIAFISDNHPGEQEIIYHNLDHTLEVVNTVLGIISPLGFDNKWKVLSWLAGLLHDIDPTRNRNTPPRVDETIKFLDSNDEIKTIINYFCETFGFTFNQVKTLILATDYYSDPKKRREKRDKFISECEIHFQGHFFPTKNDQFTNLGYVLGEILAYSDKLATYIQSIDVVLQRIKGLAFELRTLNNSESPTDIELIKNTGEFINGELFENVMFRVLPETYQNTLLNNLRLFD
jgi:hypothetical protein